MPTRDQIISNASSLLGIPYVWGGISKAGLDCSAWLSQVWGVPRQTTDTLPSVARAISKSELQPGDAMNLPTWKDPSGSGHVRLFVGWANAEKTAVEVMEETASVGRSVRRVIQYDDRYTPMRLLGVESGQPTPAVNPQPPLAQPPQVGGTNPLVDDPRPNLGPTSGTEGTGAFPFAWPNIQIQTPEWIAGLELPQGLTLLGKSIAATGNTLTLPFVQGLNQLASLMAFVGQTHIWERLGLVVLGVILVVLGIVLFAMSFVDKSTVVQAARAVAA